MNAPAPRELSLNDATIGIITALPHELAAVQVTFECEGSRPIASPRTDMGISYNVAEITSKFGGTHVVAISSLIKMGLNNASFATTQLLNDCPSVRHVIMVGIAGAVPRPEDPEKHVRLGDIVVSSQNGVVQFDVGKKTQIKGHKHTWADHRPSAVLLNAVGGLQAQAVLKSYPWETYIQATINRHNQFSRPDESVDILMDDSVPIPHPVDLKDRRPNQPRVFVGPIGSSNILLKNAVYRNKLRDDFGIMAVEMEAAGMVDATWLSGRGYLIIRGTCDYCNRTKNDDWQLYAAVIAAGYTRAVIECTPCVNTANANAAPSIPLIMEAKLDTLASDVHQIKRMLEPPASSEVPIDAAVAEAQSKQIVGEIARSWKLMEFQKAISLSLQLEDLVTKHVSHLSKDVRVSSYESLANSALIQARMKVPLGQRPDVSRATHFIERAKDASR